MDLREDEPTRAMGPRPTGPPSGRSPTAGHRPLAIGPWQVERELGRGNYGVVYLARRPDHPRPAALKVLRVTELDPEGRARFAREARVGMSLVGDPGIAGVLEVGEHRDRPWYAMEYVPGPTLQQVLREHGRLDPSRAVEVVGQLARTLSRAHARGIVHRDLKPGNVILEEPGGRPRITDLGLAKELGLSTLTATGELLGTPIYMAPEQLDDTKRTDAQADVWALGVILYECLTGRRPYQAKTITAQIGLLHRGGAEPPGADPDLDAACMRALALVPTERPSAAELADLLEGWLVQSTLPGARRRRPAAPTERAVPIPSSHRLLIVASGVLTAGLLAAGTIALLRDGRERSGAATPGGPTPAAPSTQPNAEAARLRVESALGAAEDALARLDATAWAAALSQAEQEAGDDPALRARAAAGAATATSQLERRLAGPGSYDAELEATARAVAGRLEPRGPEQAAQARRLELELGRWLLGRGRYPESARLLVGMVDAPGDAGDEAALLLTWSLCLEQRVPRALPRQLTVIEQRRSPMARAALGLLLACMGNPQALDCVADLRDDDGFEVALARCWVQQLVGRSSPRPPQSVIDREADPRAGLLLASLAAAARDDQLADRLYHAAMDQLEYRGRFLNDHFPGWIASCTLVRHGEGPDARRLSPTQALMARAWRRLLANDRAALEDLAQLFDSLDLLLAAGGMWGVLREPATRALRSEMRRWPSLPHDLPAGAPLLRRAERVSEPARAALSAALAAAGGGDDPEELDQLLTRAREAAPADPALALECARLAVGRDLESANGHIEWARTLVPPAGSSELDLLLGLHLLRTGRGNQALPVFRLVAERDQGPAGACARAELALAAGSWLAALEAADRALQLDAGFLPATVARVLALVHLEAEAAEERIERAIASEVGYADARLAGAGYELALQAENFDIAMRNADLNKLVTALWTGQRGSFQRLRTLRALTDAAWPEELGARQNFLIAPHYPWDNTGQAAFLGWAAQSVQAGLAKDEGHVGLRLTAALAHISGGGGGPDRCLAEWRQVLSSAEGASLPRPHAERFACFFPDHPWVAAWQAMEPRPPIAEYLTERLRQP